MKIENLNRLAAAPFVRIITNDKHECDIGNIWASNIMLPSGVSSRCVAITLKETDEVISLRWTRAIGTQIMNDQWVDKQVLCNRVNDAYRNAHPNCESDIAQLFAHFDKRQWLYSTTICSNTLSVGYTLQHDDLSDLLFVIDSYYNLPILRR